MLAAKCRRLAQLAGGHLLVRVNTLRPMKRQINSLLLAGGRSSRMGRDKASLVIVEGELSQAGRALGLLRQFCAETYISPRDGQDVPLGAEGVLVLRDDPGAKMQVTFDQPQSSGFGAP
jgi:hypothetical protein